MMAEIALEVAEERLASGIDWIDFELVSGSDNEVRITASILSKSIDEVYIFHFDEGNLPEDIAVQMSHLVEYIWVECGVEL